MPPKPRPTLRRNASKSAPERPRREPKRRNPTVSPEPRTARSRSASRSRPGSETTPEAPPDFCPEPQPAPRTFSRVAPDALASHLPRNRLHKTRDSLTDCGKISCIFRQYPPRFLPALSATPRKAHPPLQRLPSSTSCAHPPRRISRPTGCARFPPSVARGPARLPPAQSPLRPSVQSLRLRARTAPQLFRSRRYSSLFPKIDENLTEAPVKALLFSGRTSLLRRAPRKRVRAARPRSTGAAFPHQDCL